MVGDVEWRAVLRTVEEVEVDFTDLEWLRLNDLVFSRVGRSANRDRTRFWCLPSSEKMIGIHYRCELNTSMGQLPNLSLSANLCGSAKPCLRCWLEKSLVSESRSISIHTVAETLSAQQSR